MRTLWQIIAGIFRWTWRLLNFIRELILNLFLVLLILVGVGIYLSFQSSSTSTAPARGALLVDLSGVVVDQPSVNNRVRQWGRELLGASSSRLQENSLFDVVDSIRKAKDDKNITGMVLQLNDFAGADQPSLRYIGKALREFRDSGKPIFAIGDSYNQTQYFLASYANKIYLSPQGAVDLHGFATNNLYYKSLLDMLKVTTNIFRVGTYKSAVEPLIRDDMSPAAREADSRWIGGLWQNYLETVAANRQLTPQQLFPGAAGVLSGLQAAGGDTARYALDNKLVDELASRTAIENQLVKAFGWDKQANDFNATSIYDYQPKPDANQGGKIAVVFANGAIMDGPQTPGNVGGYHRRRATPGAPGSGHQGRSVPRQQPGRQRQRIRSDPLRTGRRARRRQAGGGLDGRHGRVGRLLGFDAGRLHHRQPEHPDRLHRYFRHHQHLRENPGYAGRAHRRRGNLAAGRHCGHQGIAARVLADDAAEHRKRV